METTSLSFQEAVATQPAWVQTWVNAMGLVIMATIVVLLVSPRTRRDALIILATMAATVVAMMALYGQVGYVRLLGIVHVVFWTPLALYLWRRLNERSITAPFRQVIWLFLAVIVVSLAFDVADVVRYIAGERQSLLPSPA